MMGRGGGNCPPLKIGDDFSSRELKWLAGRAPEKRCNSGSSFSVVALSSIWNLDLFCLSSM